MSILQWTIGNNKQTDNLIQKQYQFQQRKKQLSVNNQSSLDNQQIGTQPDNLETWTYYNILNVRIMLLNTMATNAASN